MKDFPGDEMQVRVVKSWEFAGFKCAVTEGYSSYNGYVCLTIEHSWYEAHYNDIPVEIHGGLTFGEIFGDGYWVGFDTAHAGDFLFPESVGLENNTFPFVEVVKETECLAKQLKEMKDKWELDF